MAYSSVFNGFLFIEGPEPYAQPLGKVEYNKYEHQFYNQQLLGLDKIKEQLLHKARALGANAIVDFTYGQKSTSWFRSMVLSFDDNINWYASGTAVTIPIERLRQLYADCGYYLP